MISTPIISALYLHGKATRDGIGPSLDEPSPMPTSFRKVLMLTTQQKRKSGGTRCLNGVWKDSEKDSEKTQQKELGFVHRIGWNLMLDILIPRYTSIFRQERIGETIP